MKSVLRNIPKKITLVFLITTLTTACLNAASIGQLALNVDHLYFWNRTVNATSTKIIQITNNGKSNVQIQNVSLSGSSAFKVTGWTTSVKLAPGSSLSLTVSFTPVAVTTYSGKVSIVTSVGSGQVLLDGSGAAAVAVSISPTTATLQTGTSKQFTAAVSGTTNTAVTWLVNGVLGGNSTVGTISTAGLYVAPAAVPSGSSVTVTAKSVVDATKSSNAAVTITAPAQTVAVSITPASAIIQTGASQQFAASVSGTTNTAVTWLVNGVLGGNSTVGTISTTGLYKAPAVVPSGSSVTVTAKSAADTTKSANAMVSILAAATTVSVTISPASASVEAGKTQQFSAAVSGATNTSVTWLVNGTVGGNSTTGTVSTTGLYTAPTQVPSTNPVTVTAKSFEDPTKSANAAVTVTAAPVTSGTNYYVSTTGSDSNDGSSTRPWKTLQKAASMVKPGVTVHVAPGTYASSSEIATTISGSATSRIRFVSDTKWGAKLVSTAADGTVWRNTASYMDIVGFELTSSSSSGRRGIWQRASYGRIIGNHAHHFPGACDSTGGGAIMEGDYTTHDNEYNGNVVHHVGSGPGTCNKLHGLYVSTLNGKIQNNIAYQNAGRGIQTWHAANKIVIANNTVFENGDGILIGAGDSPGGVTNDNSIISNNISYNNRNRGIYESGVTGANNRYLDNLVYSNPTNWSLQTGSQSGSISADPQFVTYKSDGTGDYHLKNTSPGVDHGTSTAAPLNDMDGKLRPQGANWDLGVYELVP